MLPYVTAFSLRRKMLIPGVSGTGCMVPCLEKASRPIWKHRENLFRATRMIEKGGESMSLEAMKQVGLGGAYLMPIKDTEQGKEFNGTVRQLSPQWWEMLRFSMQEADRLGLKLGMHICDGFALAGGPWITPQESMQKVVWSDTIVSGGQIRSLQLPRPEAYQDYWPYRLENRNLIFQISLPAL